MEPTAPTTTTPQPEAPKSSRNTLLTLVSILVLAGIAGLTLFLYIQNKTAGSPKEITIKTAKDLASGIVSAEPTAKMAKTIDEIKAKYNGVVCKRFTSLEDALASPEIACILDLSDQNLSEIPPEVMKLPFLNTLNLSNNQISSIPSSIFELEQLTNINLSHNNISSFPILPQSIKTNSKGEMIVSNVSYIDLSYNKFTEKDRNTIQKFLPLAKIIL